MLAAGGEGGIVELWDHRARRCAGTHTVDNTDGNSDITALTWDTDGLTLGVGTASGNAILYDIRSKTPIYTKEHQYSLPIVDVTFHNDSRQIISTDSKVVTSGRVCTKYCKMEGIIHEILGEIGDSK